MAELGNQFLDYAAWRNANEDLLAFLINKKSFIIARFKYVIAVVDYLFDKVTNENHKLDNNEEEMFEVGYQYIFDRFMTINDLLIHVFNKDKEEMEKLSKSINLLFYIMDFEDEIDSLDGEHKEDHKRFADLEDQVLQSIEAKTQVEDGLFALVDDISIATFDKLGIDYYGVTDIYYDIAVEFELVKEEDDDYLDIDDILRGEA